MEVSYAFLCDYADQSTKLSAIGIGFDTIYAQSVPARHPVFFAVIALRFTVVEEGAKKLAIRLIDADGKDLIPSLETTINVPRPPEGYLHSNQRIALAMHGVELPRYGDYSLRWLVDGTEVQQVPLRVAPAPPAALTG